MRGVGDEHGARAVDGGNQNREKRKSLFFSLLLSLPPTLLPSMIN